MFMKNLIWLLICPEIHLKRRWILVSAGLMTIPPPCSNEKFLCEMQQLYIDISNKKIHNINMDILSMGMTSDYVSAVKYGSTLVRIGTGLFGSRTYTQPQ